MTTAKQPRDNGTAPPAVGSRLDRRVRRHPSRAEGLHPAALAERERCISLLMRAYKGAAPGSWGNKLIVRQAALRFASMLADDRPSMCTCSEYPLYEHEPTCGLQRHWDSLPADDEDA